MQRIFHLLALYVGIALLRAKPQELPATTGVFVGAIAAAILSYVLAISAQYSVFDALQRVLLDMVILAAILHAGLILTGHRERFLQGYAALCGSAAVINIAFWPILPILGNAESLDISPPIVLATLLILYIWSVLVTAHIFRHCFATPLAVGLIVAIAYLLVVINVSSFFFPPQAAAVGADISSGALPSDMKREPR